MNILGIFLSLLALWLGCSLMSSDIDGYQIHMIVSKPVSRIHIFLGKFIGISVLTVLLAFLCGIIIYVMTGIRIKKFSPEEIKTAKERVLVGREIYFANPIDVTDEARKITEEQLAQGDNPGGKTMQPYKLKSNKRKLEKKIRRVAPGKTKQWTFEGIEQNADQESLRLRFRIFVEKVKNRDQRQTWGYWGAMYFNGKSQQVIYFTKNKTIFGGKFMDINIPVKMERPDQSGNMKTWSIFKDDGTVNLGYTNLDREWWAENGHTIKAKEKKAKALAVEILPEDGPTLAIGQQPFWMNFFRVIILISGQIVFMALLGCACGAAVSTYTAIFMAFMYLCFGPMLDYAKPAKDFIDTDESSAVTLKVSETVREVLNLVILRMNEHNHIDSLINGEFIYFAYIQSAFVHLSFLGIVIAIIGLIGFYSKEFGLVVRK